MRNPHAIEFDVNGDLLICDIGNNRILRWHPATGQIETWLDNLRGPRALAVRPDGVIFLALREGNAILRIDPQTKQMTTIASGLHGPKGIALAPDGSLYIADTESHSIVRLNPATGALTTLPIPGMKRPHGVFVDSSGTLYIGDSEAHRILTWPTAVAGIIPPIPPQSQAETAAMREARSLAESTAAAPRPLLTHAEKTQFAETGSYDECIAFYRALEKASPYARLQKIGDTAEGRPLYVFIVSKDRAFTPAAATRATKPAILLQNGIHAGENGGKDAAMMLLRDVLVTKRLASWLDRVILLSIPVFNADGHEHVSPYNRINENGPRQMGFRVTAQRLNLNRDYLKADTPEMQAWLRLYTAWLPDFLIDNHVTDGSDNQYDVTIATHMEQDIAPPVGQWVRGTFVPHLQSGMAKLGHVMGWYVESGGSPQRLAIPNYSPRYSTGYAAAQNRAALLVETHSLKSFKTRVWSHYDIMRISIDAIAGSAAGLRKAGRDADALMTSLKPDDPVVLDLAPGGKGEPYTYRALAAESYAGAASGGPVTRYTSRPEDRETQLLRSTSPKTAPPAPHGYIVPRQWAAVIGLLKMHGVQMTALPREVHGRFHTVRFSGVQFAQRPFEGRFQVASFIATPVEEDRTIPAGSMFIPAAQRAGKVAMHLLEPQAPDSAVRWGLFQSIFEQKEYFSDYVFEPYAAQMLNQDPALREEFEKKIATDQSFASTPRTRLRWLFERSPYFESDMGAYPVVRITSPSQLPAPAPRSTPAEPARRTPGQP
jgi:hypothetical protein